MTEELEKIGVDVWIAGTIYVDAASDEEAREIVAERYAGARAKANTYNHLDGEDLPLDGDDFMSSAVTLYGLCDESILLPAVDPVRDAAPDMLAALRDAEGCLEEVLEDDAEAITFERVLKAVRAAVSKAEGAK